MPSLTRRALLWSALWLAPAAHLRALAPRPPATAPTSLDQFLEVSQRLLGRSKLDPQIAQIYLDAVLSNADDAVQLAYLVESNANPTPEMRALASTIIEWWYTGVCAINGAPRLATHGGALMWSALGMPAPGTCAGAFGAWSRAPESMA